MKFVFLLSLVSLVSLFNVAHACPTLTGKYFCKSEYPNIPDSYQTYSQTKKNNFWEFAKEIKNVGQEKAESYTFVADGVERIFKDQSSDLEFNMKATCTDTSLKFEGWLIYGDYGRISFTDELTLTKEGDLKSHSTSSAGIDDNVICKRQ